jgi:MFS transporter, DHA1 family, multidrug resistance protein
MALSSLKTTPLCSASTSGPAPSLQLASLALALFLGLQPIATDLYLPALPALARDTGSPMAAVQLTMSGLILVFGLMQLVWGPVADRFGRRPVLLGSLALLLLASVATTLAPGIEALVAARMAQGAGLAGVVVCARALVRDLFEPSQGARVMAWGLSGLGVLAVMSPIAGGALAAQWGWRGSLAGVTLVVALVLLFTWRWWPETLVRPDPRALHLPIVLANAKKVWAHPTFRAWSLLIACTYAGLFTVLSASSFVYIEQLGLSPRGYGWALASGSVVYIAGTFVCRRWLAHHGLAGAVRRGAWFTLAGAAGMAVCAWLGAQAPLTGVLLSQWLFAFGHGIHQPCGQAGAVGPFPQAAGVASAWAGFLLAGVAFGVGLALGATMQGQALPIKSMGYSVGFWGLATAVVAWTLVQRLAQKPAST